jgi:hypothetical protein
MCECEREHDKIFKFLFDDVDSIFLKYSLPHKIEPKLTWHIILPRGHGWNQKGWKIMDEIHHKETFFNKTFQMNLFLVNVYP